MSINETTRSEDREFENVFRLTGARAERFLAFSRIGIVGLVFVRGMLLPSGTDRIFETAVFVLSVALSVILLLRLRKQKHTARDVEVAVVADALLCGFALSVNVLEPDQSYRGLLRMPDVSALIAMTCTTVLRVSPRAVTVGGVATSLVLLGLYALDHRLNGPRLEYDYREVSMFGIANFAVAVLGVAGARRTRRLVREAYQASRVAANAASRFAVVLRDHHDARGTLASAVINVERLERVLDRPEEARRLAANVKEDLAALERMVAIVRDESLVGAAEHQGISPADIAVAAARASEATARRFGEVKLSVEASGLVGFVAGAAGLERALANLLVNACEGDGKRGAREVTLRSAAEGDRVRVVVEDDGPGFDPAILAAGSASVSAKAGGGGVGLALVRGLVEASGGTMQLANRERSGGRVVLVLRSSSGL